MCVNNLSKVALDSAAAEIEPATSSRKSNAITTAPPSHTTAKIPRKTANIPQRPRRNAHCGDRNHYGQCDTNKPK